MNKLELHKHKADVYDMNSEDPNTQIILSEIERHIANETITTKEQIDDFKQL